VLAVSNDTKTLSSACAGGQSSTFHMISYTVLPTLCPQRVPHLLIGVLLSYLKCNGSLLIFHRLKEGSYMNSGVRAFVFFLFIV